jgi:hypothetical protein
MQPRAELALGTALLLVLAVGAGSLGARRARQTDIDGRRSTFLTGPAGARGYAEALARLGVRVEPFRRPLSSLDSAPGRRTLVAFLGPSRRLSSREGAAVARLDADLLLAGSGAAAAMRCLGYEIRPRLRDSLEVWHPPGGERLPWPRVRATLQRRRTDVAVDSAGGEDAAPITCTAPAARTVDTLLRATRGPVAVRVGLDGRRAVTLVADDRLFENRTLRRTAAGGFALGLVVPRYRRMLVDEYHHGFDASRSLAGAAIDWILRTPWGWGILQLSAAGLLALLAAGVRFGPIRSGIERRRRSPLEHVRALATALGASRGHDVAVGLIIQGLRRRLSRAGRVSRGEIGPWLEGLAPAVRTPRGRAALDSLTAIARRPASSEDVLQAADAVETLWEELTPT